MKHYVINLNRRPDRLAFWYGWMKAKEVLTTEVNSVEAVDKNDFRDIPAIAKHAVGLGFAEWEKLYDFPAHLKGHAGEDLKGYAALRLTHDCLLRYILAEEEDDDYYVIWNDDRVLSVDYSNFVSCVDTFDSDPAVKIVAMNAYWCEYQDPEAERWNDRENRRHPHLNLYAGCVGGGFNECIVVTREGVSELLKFGAEHPGDSYLYRAFRSAEHRPFFWTSTFNFVLDIGYLLGSDIVDTAPDIALWRLVLGR